MKQTLKVYATGTGGMEPKLEAQTGRDGDTLRFVGWTFDASPENGPNGAWVLKSEPEEVTYCPEYVRAVRSGSLAPADEATAKLCGVAFIKRKS